MGMILVHRGATIFSVIFYCVQSYAIENHQNEFNPVIPRIGHFTVVFLVAKPLIWSEAEGDLVVLETRI